MGGRGAAFEPRDGDEELVDLQLRTSPIGDGDALLIAVHGELVLASSDQVRSAADAAVTGRRPLILDLSECEFIDSTGIHLVLQISIDLEDGGGPAVPMAIVIGRSRMHDKLAIASIDKRVPMFDTVEQAVESLTAP